MKRIEIPIQQTGLPNGSIRYWVSISVGTARLKAMLDSGSVGLRLLPRAVPTKAVKKLHHECVYAYSSGVEMKGRFAHAQLAFDGVRLNRTVLVQAVQRIGCTPHRPDCPAPQIRAAGYRIFGEGFPGQGFRGVLGVGLRPAGVQNPLINFGDAWIIRLPLPNDKEPGSLIINPSAHERRGYTHFVLSRAHASSPFGDVAGWRDVITGTLTNVTSRRSISGPIALDTGAPFISIVSGDESELQPWTRGSRAKLQFRGDERSLIAMKFKTQHVEGSRVVTSRPIARQWEGVRAGILPFHSFLVLYDNKRGRIGLKQRFVTPGRARRG